MSEEADEDEPTVDCPVWRVAVSPPDRTESLVVFDRPVCEGCAVLLLARQTMAHVYGLARDAATCLRQASLSSSRERPEHTLSAGENASDNVSCLKTSAVVP